MNDTKNISIKEFEQIDIRCGTIVAVEDFPEAKKPAYKVSIDLGDEIGIKRSSAQITGLYSKDTLLGKQILAVVNFPPRQIANFFSEVLILGFADEKGSVILVQPERPTENGAKLT